MAPILFKVSQDTLATHLHCIFFQLVGHQEKYVAFLRGKVVPIVSELHIKLVIRRVKQQHPCGFRQLPWQTYIYQHAFGTLEFHHSACAFKVHSNVRFSFLIGGNISFLAISSCQHRESTDNILDELAPLR